MGRGARGAGAGGAVAGAACVNTTLNHEECAARLHLDNICANKNLPNKAVVVNGALTCFSVHHGTSAVDPLRNDYGRLLDSGLYLKYPITTNLLECLNHFSVYYGPTLRKTTY